MTTLQGITVSVVLVIILGGWALFTQSNDGGRVDYCYIREFEHENESDPLGAPLKHPALMGHRPGKSFDEVIAVGTHSDTEEWRYSTREELIEKAVRLGCPVRSKPWWR